MINESEVRDLTEKQKIFCDEYLVDLNATRAYKAAYPKVKKDTVAAASAARLLTNVKSKFDFKQLYKSNCFYISKVRLKRLCTRKGKFGG